MKNSIAFVLVFVVASAFAQEDTSTTASGDYVMDLGATFRQNLRTSFAASWAQVSTTESG